MSPNPPGLVAGESLTLKATARDSKGSAIQGRTFTWSSNAVLTATVSSAGVVTGVTVGFATITVTDQGSGINTSVEANVTTFTRRAGSFLTLVTDSVFQFGEYTRATTLAWVDSARSGSDQRVGLVHTAGADPNPPISRLNYPLLDAIAECPNGLAYAVSNARGDQPPQLWQLASGANPVDPISGVVTLVGVINTTPNILLTMACDASNSLLVAGNFGGFGELFRISPTSRQVTTISGFGESYLGIAQSTNGAIYATTYNPFSSNTGELLVTINPSSGVPTATGTNQDRQAIYVTQLVFRGLRLLGKTGNRLLEMNTSSGVVSDLRIIKIP